MDTLITIIKVLIFGTIIMTYVYYSKATGKWLFRTIKNTFFFIIKLPFVLIRILISSIERRLQRAKS